MLGFWDWFTIHNNWVGGVSVLALFVFWGWSLASNMNTWKGKTIAYLLVSSFGALMLFLGTYQGGYVVYKRHWNTCTKTEAVKAFYVFDFKKERCLKPVVGFAPVDDTTVTTLTPKQMETGEWL